MSRQLHAQATKPFCDWVIHRLPEREVLQQAGMADMKGEAKKSLKVFVIARVVYAVLVAVYFSLVLHCLGTWLEGVYRHERNGYAGVALGLIVCQCIVLSLVTSGRQ